MAMPKPYWIKERTNPQLGVYYVAYGQMSVSAASRMSASLYGSNRMLRFNTLNEYEDRLVELKRDGNVVHVSNS